MGRPAGIGLRLVLNNDGGKWRVARRRKRKRGLSAGRTPLKVAGGGRRSKLVGILKAIDAAAGSFVSKPIGKSADVCTVILLWCRTICVRVVNNAQAYVEHFIQERSDRELPVLSPPRRLKLAGVERSRSFVEVEKAS